MRPPAFLDNLTPEYHHLASIILDAPPWRGGNWGDHIDLNASISGTRLVCSFSWERSYEDRQGRELHALVCNKILPVLFCFPSHLIPSPLLFSLPRTRNFDQGPHSSRRFFPSPHYGTSVPRILKRECFSTCFLPSSTL